MCVCVSDDRDGAVQRPERVCGARRRNHPRPGPQLRARAAEEGILVQNQLL